METLALPGRVLFLTTSEDGIRAQLAGRSLSLAEAGALPGGGGTDQMTPVPSRARYDGTLGRSP